MVKEFYPDRPYFGASLYARQKPSLYHDFKLNRTYHRQHRAEGDAGAGFGGENVMDTKLDEHRKLQRHRTLKAGSITFNRASGIDCRVRNLSAGGACLEVASQIGIPDDFVLVIEADHLKQPCHVIWRSTTRLGVTFTAE